MSAAPRKSRDRLSGLTAHRESAIPDAIRHSARVTRLRRWMLWGAGAIVALVGVALLISSFRLLPVDLSLTRVALNGTRIIIEAPKLTGYRKDGRPYEIRAKVGAQDMTKPNIFELEKLEVRIENTADNMVILTAAQGVYNANKDHADMTGGVNIHDEKNFDLKMDAAQMDFKAGVLSSDKSALLKLVGGEVKADAVEFSQKERRATFTGNVRSTLYGEDNAPADALRTVQ